MRKTILCALALAITAAGPAHSADVTIPLTITLIKSTTPIFKFVGKGNPIPFPLPPGTDDPTLGGGTLVFDDTGAPGNSATFTLPAAGWTGLGNPAGSKGFKYKGAGTPGDPCKVVLVKTNVIKAVCKSAGSFTGPASGTVAVTLSLGVTPTRYCAECGGTTLKNQAGLFKAKNCPAPPSCTGSPSGAFLSQDLL
jgi:hypothetical protein